MTTYHGMFSTPSVLGLPAEINAIVAAQNAAIEATAGVGTDETEPVPNALPLEPGIVLPLIGNVTIANLIIAAGVGYLAFRTTRKKSMGAIGAVGALAAIGFLKRSS